MGQQQLILLVLGIVVVGIAISVGIDAFEVGNKQANADSMINDAIEIATEAQVWMLKPSIYGGGGNSCQATCDWSNLAFSTLGYTIDESGNYSNINATYEIDVSDPSQVVITGTSASIGNQITVIVTGLGPNTISATIDVNYSPTS